MTNWTLCEWSKGNKRNLHSKTQNLKKSMFLLLKTKNSNKIAIVLPHLSIFFSIPEGRPSSSKDKEICVKPEGKKGSDL